MRNVEFHKELSRMITHNSAEVRVASYLPCNELSMKFIYRQHKSSLGLCQLSDKLKGTQESRKSLQLNTSSTKELYEDQSIRIRVSFQFKSDSDSDSAF